MVEYIRIFIAACFYYSGLVRLALWWTRRSEKRLIVLNYHQASGKSLRHHMMCLRCHYRILHLEQALEEMYTPCQNEPREKDQRTLVALTFDDGYYDNYTHAFKLASELQVPITIFLVPGYIESGACFWWLEGEHFLRHAQIDTATIEGHTYHLQQPEEHQALLQAIDAHARYATSVTEREHFLTSTREALALSQALSIEEQLALPLKWSEVREMDASGWVSFGAHTMHHPILGYLADRAEVQREVEECRHVLEEQLGHPIRLFAYPVGQPEHIGEHAVRAVKQTGYNWAVTTVYGFNTVQSNPHLLQRVWVDVDQHWLLLIAELSGVWGLFYRLRCLPNRLFQHLCKGSVDQTSSCGDAAQVVASNHSGNVPGRK